MATTSFRASAFPLSPSLSSPKLDHHTRISFPKPMYSRQARSVSADGSNFSNFRTKAAPKGNLETVTVPPSVSVQEAYELLLAGYSYLDVRTTEEFKAGHPPGAINIPYQFSLESDDSLNKNFVPEVSSRFAKDDNILVGCKVGRRSIKAATDLVAAAFSGIKNVEGGFVAWVENGLPVEK